ncbi:MAG: LamG domain-containing protein, partial [Candidatus Paceibacterota bacterium]
NTTSTGNYYTYITGGSWELTSSMESAKYKLGGANDKTSKDGGSYTGLYELGTNLTLLPLDYGDTSLVGYWKFDEGTGTTAYDASGHGNNGTLNNGPSYTTGKVGSYALSFDGSDDDVYCGGSSSLNSTSYTISVWFKTTAISPDNQTAQRMVSLSRASGSTKISLMMRVDKPKLIANGGEIETSSNTVSNDGNWHNFTTTYNGSSFLLYLDGSQKNSVSGVLSSAFQGCTIGSLLGSPSQGYFDGYIDDVRIYNRVLSAAEISAIYNLAK